MNSATHEQSHSSAIGYINIFNATCGVTLRGQFSKAFGNAARKQTPVNCSHHGIDDRHVWEVEGGARRSLVQPLELCWGLCELPTTPKLNRGAMAGMVPYEAGVGPLTQTILSAVLSRIWGKTMPAVIQNCLSWAQDVDENTVIETQNVLTGQQPTTSAGLHVNNTQQPRRELHSCLTPRAMLPYLHDV